MKNKKITKLLALFLAVMMFASALISCSSMKDEETRYAEAFGKLEAGDYEAAYALFTELGDYKDSAKEAAKFRYAPVSFVEDVVNGEEAYLGTTVITYNENNLPVTCASIYTDGYEHVCTFTYNENGKLINHSCANNEEEEGDTTEYVYDQNGNVIKTTYHYSDGYVYIYEVTYTESGKDATIKAENNEGYYAFYEYFYDENDNMIRVEAVDDGETFVYECFHNEDNLLMTVTGLSGNGDMMTTEHTYDENNNLIKEIDTKNGEIVKSTEYTYDENGKILTEKYESTEGFGYIDKNTYDEHGNLVKKEEKYNDGYENIRETVFKLVYVPFEYSDEEWNEMINQLYYW